MRQDKAKAIKLRKKGFSYNEIEKKLGIPKSTLSYWLSKLEISPEAKEKIAAKVHKGSVEGLIKRNINQTKLAKDRADKIRLEAKNEFKELLNNSLFLTGVSLYWAEGYKRGAEGSRWKSVDFANSDPEMVKVMMKFFLDVCNIRREKIRIQLIAHRNVDVEEAVDYWAKLTKVPRNQFIKTCCSINQNSKNKRKNNLTHGTVHIRINSVEFFFRVIGWIDGLKSFFKEKSAGIV